MSSTMTTPTGPIHIENPIRVYLIDQGREAGVPVFVKQLGSDVRGLPGWNVEGGHKDGKGGDPEEWPARLRVRQMTEAPTP